MASATAVNKRSMKVYVNAVDVSDQFSTAKFTSAETDSDFVTFADAAAGGGRDYAFEGTMAQDAATGSVWYLMSASGGSSVVVLLKPYGNSAASPTQPHYSATAVISEPDGDYLGGDADASTTAVQTTDIVWSLTAKPSRLTA